MTACGPEHTLVSYTGHRWGLRLSELVREQDETPRYSKRRRHMIYLVNLPLHRGDCPGSRSNREQGVHEPPFCPHPACRHHLQACQTHGLWPTNRECDMLDLEHLCCHHFLQQAGPSLLCLLGSWGLEGSCLEGLDSGCGWLQLTQKSSSRWPWRRPEG